MRLIDADAFKRRVALCIVLSNIDPENAKAILDMIDVQPTIEERKDVWTAAYAHGYQKGYDDGYATGITQPI